MKRKIILIVLAIIAFAPLLKSCRYKEGPAISFIKVENRLAGKWEVESFMMNDIDCTMVYKEKCDCGFSFNYERTTRICGLIDCKPDSVNIYGYYSFIDGGNKTLLNIKLNEITSQDTITRIYFGPIGTYTISDWKIQRLTKDEMKMSANYNGVEYVFEFGKIINY